MKKQLLFAVLIFFLSGFRSGAQQTPNFLQVLSTASGGEQLLYPALVEQFYTRNTNKLFWMLTDEKGESMRRKLLEISDSSFLMGFVAKKYHFDILSASSTNGDSTAIITADRLYTDAAIAMSKDIYQGFNTGAWVEYDQLSAKYEETDNQLLISGLLESNDARQLQHFFETLEPRTPEFTALKTAYRLQRQQHAADTASLLYTAMNYYRWIHHFHFKKFIVVNVPSAWGQFYENDSLQLFMKTVVGKPSTPTPRFATVCDQLILYPYWYIPPSIFFNEYLANIKKDPSWIDSHNMQVIDDKGRVIDHTGLNWSAYHRGYFPYRLRQSTGCDNALGVIKFNIITPYGVYLHDTNNKTAFLSGSRFYSHGCIRLESPFELGNKLLNGKLDTTFLQSCFKEEKPVIVFLQEPVPVFVVYMRAIADPFGKVRYFRDIYSLTK